MKCPFCENPDTKVIDSRPTEEGHAIRRRRGCDKCGKRFTTYEKVEETILMVAKKDSRREVFDRSKVLNGIANGKGSRKQLYRRACHGRIEKSRRSRLCALRFRIQAVYGCQYFHKRN